MLVLMWIAEKVEIALMGFADVDPTLLAVEIQIPVSREFVSVVQLTLVVGFVVFHLQSIIDVLKGNASVETLILVTKDLPLLRV